MEPSTATRCEHCRELIEQKNNTIEFQQNKLINYQDLLVKAQRDLIDTKNELLRIKAKYSIGFRIYGNSDGEDSSTNNNTVSKKISKISTERNTSSEKKMYNSDRHRDRNHGSRKYKLFLGNVVRPVTALVLKKYLESSFGPVIEPYAFVYFADSISYYKAVNSGKLSIGDVTVRIEEIRVRRH
nr:12644_t:CDS:2 [Entrophospora candida]